MYPLVDTEELVQQEMATWSSLADNMRPFIDSNMMSMTLIIESSCGALFLP